MPEDGSPEKGRDARLDAIIAEYLDRLHGGDAPDRGEFLALNPEFAAELIEFFEDYDRFEDLLEPLRPRPFVPCRPLPDDLEDYEILEEIGSGGMGVVYRARQKSLGRVVAVKMVRAGTLASPEEAARLRREAEAAARLSHPHIISIHEIGEHHGRPYFSMEYVEGGKLSERLWSYESNPTGAARLVEEIARAVHYAHQRQVVHRDLKPGNILFDASGRPHIADFGLARLLGLEGDASRPADVGGTPAYLAPEITQGVEQPTTAVDVYGLGAVLYSLLTGVPPFRGPTVFDILEQVRTRAPTPPSALNAAAGADIEAVCMKCLAKDPAERYPSAEALADDLDRFARGLPVKARTASVPERAWKWARRKPTVAALLVVSIGALAILLGVWARYGQELRSALDDTQDREKLARHYLYLAEMNLAHEAWMEGHIDRVEEILEKSRDPGEGKVTRSFDWFYLWRRLRARSQPWLLRDPASCLAVAPRHGWVAVASARGQVRQWNPESGAEGALIEWEGSNVTTIAYSPDGDRVALGSAETAERGSGHVGVFRSGDGEILWESDAHADNVRDLSFSFDGLILATAGSDGKVKLLEASSGREIASLAGHARSVEAVAFSPAGDLIASGGLDGTIRLWRLREDPEATDLQVEEAASWTAHERGVLSLAFSPQDPATLVSAGLDVTVTRWAVPSGERRGYFALGREGARRVRFSPNGLKLAAGGIAGATGNDDRMLLWDFEQGTLLAELASDADSFAMMDFLPDGAHVVVPTIDAVGRFGVRLWELDRLQEPTVLHQGARVTSLAFSPEGLFLAVGDASGNATIWRRYTAERWRSFRDRSAMSVTAVEFVADGTTLATAGSNKLVVLRDFYRDAVIDEVQSPGGVLNCLGFDPEGGLLAMGAHRSVRIWNWNGKSVLRDIEGHADRVYCLEFSPDGRLLATGGPDGVRVWSTSGWEEVAAFEVEGADVRSLCFGAAGGLLFAGGSDGRILSWSIGERTSRPSLRGHRGAVRALRLSPHEGSLASSGDDGTVRLWDVESGQERLALLRVQARIVALAFSPDGGLLACGGTDGLVRLFHAATPGEVQAYAAPEPAKPEPVSVSEPGMVPREVPAGWIEVAKGPLAGRGRCQGSAWGDYDGDGDYDVYLANNGTNRLLRNDSGTFSDVTPPPLAVEGNSYGCAWADCDNDGDLDLAVASGDAGARIFRNDGPAGFSELRLGLPKRELSSRRIAWIDADGDRDLDLAIAGYNTRCRILRNDGSVFTSVWAPISPDMAPNCASFATGDGDHLDVCFGSGYGTGVFILGDGGGGSPRLPGVMVPVPGGRAGTWGDFDGDGRLDLFITLANHRSRLLRSDGGARLVEADGGYLGHDGSSSAAGDYDNDGDLDLFMCSNGPGYCLLGNRGDGTFSNETRPPIDGTLDAYTGAFVDQDGDGRLDLFVAEWNGKNRLYRNVLPGTGHWLELDLEGTVSNRSAVGARVLVVAGGRTQVREVWAGGAGNSEGPLTVHVGLGDVRVAERIEVRWPSGRHETLTRVDADVRLRIREGDATEGRGG